MCNRSNPRVWLIGCVLACKLSGVHGQMHIENGDFESMVACPDYLSQIEQAVGWFDANKATADYLNACDDSDIVGVPENYFGEQSAHSGQGYAGIYVSETDGPIYREFIETALTSTLLPDHAYALDLYVSLSEQSSCIPSNLCVYLSSEPLLDTTTNGYLTQYSIIRQQLCLNSDTAFANTNDWILLHFCFRATGDEHFLTIGNNDPDYSSPCLHDMDGAFKAYLYIDDITLQDMPVNTIEMDTIICKGASVMVELAEHLLLPINATPIVHWQDGPVGMSRTFTQAGTYTAEIDNGCAVDTFRINISWIYDCPELFYFPNAFSPNGDGINDLYRMYIENVTIDLLEVYDRWGNRVYSGEHDPLGWDGTIHGNAAETGMYVYHILYTTNITEEQVEKFGALQLVR